jgi:hypothetical protein
MMSELRLAAVSLFLIGTFHFTGLSAADYDFTQTGNFKAISKKDNCIDFKCSNGFVKLEFCAEDLIRI